VRNPLSLHALILGCVVTLSCRAAAPTLTPASPSGASPVAGLAAVSAVDAASETSDLQDKVNGLRRSQGVPELGFPAALQQISLARALDLASRRALDHTLVDGQAAVQAQLESAGYSGRIAELVLQVTDGGPSLASTVLRAWVSDPAHQSALLEPAYRVAGIGMAASPEGWIVVQVLAEQGGEEVSP
jgi:uncharacterized protein YkwD